jgi:DNA-binding transcriptional ArsR family regulator
MSRNAERWAWDQKGLRPATKLVLLYLADFHTDAHGCFPSQSLLAERCEMHRASLNRHLDSLEEAGLIRREQRTDERTGRQTSTRYYLGFERAAVSQNETRPVSQNETGDCLKMRQGTVSKCDTNLKTLNLREIERETLPLEAPHSEPETVSKQIPNVSRVEREGSAEKGKKGSRLLDSFTVPTDWIAWAEDQGMPPDMAQLEAAKFPDFWRSQPGSKGVKLDWLATWRNWCRSAMQRANIKPASQGGRMSDAQAMEWCVEMLIEPIREADRIRREFAAQPDKAPKLHPRLREMVDAVDQTCKERGWTDEKRRLLGQAARERLAEQARLV